MDGATADVGHKYQKLENRSTSKNGIRNKEFFQRNSLIDDLMNSQHIVTVHRMFMAIIIGLMLHNAVHEYLYKGVINFGQNLIILGFTGFIKFWYTWIPIFLSAIISYYCFKCWAALRTSMPLKSRTIKLWDNLWLGVIIISYPGWIYVVAWLILKQKLSVLLVIALTGETTRLMMKIHAFIRSNAPRVINYKRHSENDVLCPKFSQFMYFLWAPTLIYRDNYPRTKNIRWSYVAVKAAEFIVIIICMSVIVERYFIFSFKDYGIKTYTWTDIAVITIGNAGGGMLLLLCVFYIVLHIWMTGFAEILKFGDRLFYQDWWTSPGYDRYYRTWNIIVHDWLYTYVFCDFYAHVVPGNKFISKYAVFFVSAVFHEYVLALSFGFFLPILFIQFFILGTIMTYVKIKPDMVGNIVLLYTLGLGNSITCTFYSIEYFARINCPIEDQTVYSYFYPRLFHCARS